MRSHNPAMLIILPASEGGCMTSGPYEPTHGVPRLGEGGVEIPSPRRARAEEVSPILCSWFAMRAPASQHAWRKVVRAIRDVMHSGSGSSIIM